MNASQPAVPARRVVPDPAWMRDIVRDVLPVVLLTRVLFIGLTLLIPAWRAWAGVAPLLLIHVNGAGPLLDAWNRWDTRWYDDLAQLGYNLRGPNDYKNVAFFPLYPLLTRTLHDAIALVARGLLGLAPHDPTYPSYLISGLIVSNLCAVAALAFFYGLVRLDYGRGAAQRAVTLLALFPPSVFLGAAYSEGTFLLCATACFFALRLERWWQAGLWGLLAGATRPPGVVLLAPFILAWAAAHPDMSRALFRRLRLAGHALVVWLRVRVYRVQRQTVPASEKQPAAVLMPLDFTVSSSAGRTPRRRAGDLRAGPATVLPRRSILRRPLDWLGLLGRALRVASRAELRHLLPALLIPVGLLLYMAFLYHQFGDPLWFSRAQKAWWRTFAPPWETLVISITWPLGDVLHGKITYWDPYAVHDLAYEIGGLVVTWLAWRRLPRAQGLYLWLLWLVLLSSPAMLAERPTGEPHRDVLMSLPRMLLMLFPLFTYLGLQRRLYPWLAGAFAIGLVIYTSMFLTGGWIS